MVMPLARTAVAFFICGDTALPSSERPLGTLEQNALGVSEGVRSDLRNSLLL